MIARQGPPQTCRPADPSRPFQADLVVDRMWADAWRRL